MVWRCLGANFDQMHMNTNLGWLQDHPDFAVVGVCDEDPSTSTGSIDDAASSLSLSEDAIYDDLDRALEDTDPDVVMGCPRNSEHAAFVERVAPYDAHVVIEKPLAVTLDQADRMIDAMAEHDGRLFINWPAAWDPERHTLKRLVDDGVIGDVVEIQYYGGNAGAPPDDSWFYDPEEGGGAMLDYLGYGSTFSTWFRGGELPESVTAESYTPPEEDVNVQSATICRYDKGLSTLQTTWRMLTNPWEVQPMPGKGYDIVGTKGSISNRDRQDTIRVTTTEKPEGYAIEPDDLEQRYRNLAYYLVHCFENDIGPEGPLDPVFCREAHRIVDTARASANEGRRLELKD